MRHFWLGSLAVLAAVSARAQDDGAAVFETRCASCHAREAGAEPGPGPNLHGLAGRRVGGDPDYDYSPALRAARGVWDAARLERFLREPDDEIPGNWMGNAFRDPAERAAVIRWLIDR